MSMNSFGHLYRFTTWGESHGKAIGVTIDGCPPKIDLNEPLSVIGKSTKEAMLSGAVIGYRGLVKGILLSIFDELGEVNIPVIATGGYSKLISSNIEEIVEVNEKLTLEGLRIIAALNTQDDN